MLKAVRQGDVLVRPIAQRVIASESEIDWNVLRSISARHLRLLQNNHKANRNAAEDAVANLYDTLELARPVMVWYDGNILSPGIVGTPIRSTIETITSNLLLGIPEKQRVLAQLGYDPHVGQFRLATNKRLLSPEFRVRRRSNTRPPWTIDLGNMISQFDRSALMLYELEKESDRVAMNAVVAGLADAISQVLDSTFAIIMFEATCILLDRPNHISIDQAQLLSNTLINPTDMQLRSKPCPAYDPRFGMPIYAVNGVVIPEEIIRSVSSTRSYNVLSSIGSPRTRSAAIAYLGWESFFAMVPKHARHLIDESKYGQLWEIHCGGQDMLAVRVKNATPEPDGTYRHYVIPVDRRCRPIPNPADPNAQFGAIQQPTALNAVASTFGLTGEEYESNLGDQS